MGDKTKIEWCDATVNPIRAESKETGKIGWYCQKVNDGCRVCYAERINGWRGNGARYAVDEAKKVYLFLDGNVLARVVKWKRPRRIFWVDMSDLFADFVPPVWIVHCLQAMRAAPQHTHLILTKRAERMKLFDIKWYGNHIHAGCSVSDQKTADEQIPHLLQTNAAVRWISYEPALGPIDLRPYLPGHISKGWTGRADEPCVSQFGINWTVAGGESGPKARPSHPDWFRALRDQCQAAGVPFFFKQWGEWVPGYSNNRNNVFMSRDPAVAGVGPVHMEKVTKKCASRLLDGREWSEYPAGA